MMYIFGINNVHGLDLIKNDKNYILNTYKEN